MTDTTTPSLEDQLSDLNNKLQASLMGGQGLAKRIAAIRQAIALVEAQIDAANQESTPDE